MFLLPKLIKERELIEKLKFKILNVNLGHTTTPVKKSFIYFLPK